MGVPDVAVRHAIAFPTLNVRHCSIKLRTSAVSLARKIPYCGFTVTVGTSQTVWSGLRVDTSEEQEY